MTFKTAGYDLMNIKRLHPSSLLPCIELESVVTVIDSKLRKLLAPVMEERKGKKGVVPLCQNAFASCCIILESSWHLISFQLSLYTYLKLRRCYVAAWRYYWIWKELRLTAYRRVKMSSCPFHVSPIEQIYIQTFQIWFTQERRASDFFFVLFSQIFWEVRSTISPFYFGIILNERWCTLTMASRLVVI